MLEDKYGNEKSRLPYEEWLLFPSLLYVSFGINRKFDDLPKTVSGFTYKLKEPVTICGEVRNWLQVHVFNQYPTLAPQANSTCAASGSNRVADFRQPSCQRKGL